MVSQTKNKQREDNIFAMTEKIFPSDSFVSCKELTEGYFNAAYEVDLQSGQSVILKIAPEKNMRIMTYEKNIMFSEVDAMKTVESVNGIPAPAVIGFDDSCTVCSSPYFFMEKIQGESLHSIKSTLSKKQLANIYRHAGEITRKINSIERPVFGYPGQKDFQGDMWFDVFKKMLEAAVKDAENVKVDTKISADKLFGQLKKDKDIFDEITVPHLVHWDIWDGNIFIKDGEVTGIIDWERAVWADPLMEVGFRTYSVNKDFLAGYGIKKLSKNQYRRALWYDVYVLLLMTSEGAYRQYETNDVYEFASAALQKSFRKLNRSFLS